MKTNYQPESIDYPCADTSGFAFFYFMINGLLSLLWGTIYQPPLSNLSRIVDINNTVPVCVTVRAGSCKSGGKWN